MQESNSLYLHVMKMNVLRTQLLFLFLIGFLLAWCISGCQTQNESWQRIEETGILRVGLDPTYPPFEVADSSGAVSGLDVDLAHALADGLGLKVQFSHFGYDGLYDALATGQVDVLISAMVIVPGRTKDFAYSDPYFNAGEILIVPVENMDITEMADLNGRSLAVELGAQGHVEATQWAKKLPDLTIVPFSSPEEVLTAVGNSFVGNDIANAAIIDSISGRLFLIDHPELKRLPEPVTVDPFALVVRADDELLLQKLDATLDSLEQTGQLETIISHWLEP